MAESAIRVGRDSGGSSVRRNSQVVIREVENIRAICLEASDLIVNG